MKLRLPLVWPSFTFLTVALSLHTVLVCLVLLGSDSREQADAMFAATAPLALVYPAIYYGFRRVRSFHPAFQPEYRAWLARTPWTPAKGMPLGPVHLVLADAVLLGLAVAASWPYYGAAGSLDLVKIFLGAYTSMLLLTLFVTGERLAAYTVWAGLGTMLLFRSLDGPFYAAAAATYLVGMIGFRRSLGRFPWNFSATSTTQALNHSALDEEIHRARFAWPFAYLSPGTRYLSLGLVDGVVLALLGGWTLFVALSLFPPRDHDGLYAIMPNLILLAAVARVFVYRVNEHRPPISLSGRVATGRWIVPAYDRVFVAPLLAAVVAAIFSVLFYRWNVPAGLGATTTFAASLLILFTGGPTRREWLLTAPSRVVPAATGRKQLWA
jgi:hypothetical protein